MIQLNNTRLFRDVIVPAFPGTLLLSQWIATKAIPEKNGTNHIPEVWSFDVSVPFEFVF